MAQNSQEVGKNIVMRVEGRKLIIEIDLDKEFGLSGSGKSITVASTGGNIAVPNNEEIKLGVNAYKQTGKHR